MTIYELFLNLLFIFCLNNIPHIKATFGEETCPTYFCSGEEIKFPFRLWQPKFDLCGYPGFDLSCNNKSQTILNLPNAGDFRVTFLSYASQIIWMNDPENCLPKRLLNFSLSGSPFSAGRRQSYTYVNCSTEVSIPGYTHFPCLGGGDNYRVYVGPSSLLSYKPPSCAYIERVMVPVVGLGLPGVKGDVKLRWTNPKCGSCERKGGSCGFRSYDNFEVGCFNLPNSGLPRTAKYGIIIGVGIPGIMCLIGLGCYIVGKIRAPFRPNNHNMDSRSSATPQPCVTIMGLDGPTIDSYPKIVLGESKRLPKPNDDGHCPICLCEYQPKEIVRSIPECNHFFHAECIDEWLRLNAACPLCRNTPDGSSHVTSSSMSNLSSSSSLSVSSFVI